MFSRDEDALFALSLQQQECSKNVSYLEYKASLALKNLNEANERNAPQTILDLLNVKYQKKLVRYENAKNNMQQPFNGFNFTHSMFQQPNLQSVSRLHYAQALQFFSEEEKKVIIAHYKTIPDDLKNLFDAVLSDENIEFDIITNPVFIKGDGHVYDLSTVEKIIATNGKNPFDQNMKFTRENIIPCNTLIKAIQLLLNIIDGQEFINQPVEANCFSNRASLNISQMIETFYQVLPAKHQRLFDIICRDPITNMIMDDPVFLPDGYVYNRSTVLFLLESGQPMTSVPCFLDNNIYFKKEDITKCYLISLVYEHLKKIAEQKNSPIPVETMKRNIV